MDGNFWWQIAKMKIYFCICVCVCEFDRKILHGFLTHWVQITGKHLHEMIPIAFDYILYREFSKAQIQTIRKTVGKLLLNCHTLNTWMDLKQAIFYIENIFGVSVAHSHLKHLIYHGGKICFQTFIYAFCLKSTNHNFVYKISIQFCIYFRWERDREDLNWIFEILIMKFLRGISIVYRLL